MRWGSPTTVGWYMQPTTDLPRLATSLRRRLAACLRLLSDCMTFPIALISGSAERLRPEWIVHAHIARPRPQTAKPWPPISISHGRQQKRALSFLLARPEPWPHWARYGLYRNITNNPPELRDTLSQNYARLIGKITASKDATWIVPIFGWWISLIICWRIKMSKLVNSTTRKVTLLDQEAKTIC